MHEVCALTHLLAAAVSWVGTSHLRLVWQLLNHLATSHMLSSSMCCARAAMCW